MKGPRRFAAVTPALGLLCGVWVAAAVGCLNFTDDPTPFPEDDPSAGSTCGDAKLQEGEECDGGDLNGTGHINCSSGCRFVQTPCAVESERACLSARQVQSCLDGLWRQVEQCDSGQICGEGGLCEDLPECGGESDRGCVGDYETLCVGGEIQIGAHCPSLADGRCVEGLCVPGPKEPVAGEGEGEGEGAEAEPGENGGRPAEGEAEAEGGVEGEGEGEGEGDSEGEGEVAREGEGEGEGEGGPEPPGCEAPEELCRGVDVLSGLAFCEEFSAPLLGEIYTAGDLFGGDCGSVPALLAGRYTAADGCGGHTGVFPGRVSRALSLSFRMRSTDRGASVGLFRGPERHGGAADAPGTGYEVRVSFPEGRPSLTVLGLPDGEVLLAAPLDAVWDVADHRVEVRRRPDEAWEAWVDCAAVEPSLAVSDDSIAVFDRVSVTFASPAEAPAEDEDSWIDNIVLVVDVDGDGIVEPADNCPDVANADQLDLNGDGVGTACSDPDEDAVEDPDDNCPWLPNRRQVDQDGDGRGDGCDFDGGVLLVGRIPDGLPDPDEAGVTPWFIDLDADLQTPAWSPDADAPIAGCHASADGLRIGCDLEGGRGVIHVDRLGRDQGWLASDKTAIRPLDGGRWLYHGLELDIVYVRGGGPGDPPLRWLEAEPDERVRAYPSADGTRVAVVRRTADRATVELRASDGQQLLLIARDVAAFAQLPEEQWPVLIPHPQDDVYLVAGVEGGLLGVQELNAQSGAFLDPPASRERAVAATYTPAGDEIVALLDTGGAGLSVVRMSRPGDGDEILEVMGPSRTLSPGSLSWITREGLQWFDADGDGIDDRGDSCPGRTNRVAGASRGLGAQPGSSGVNFSTAWSGEEFVAVQHLPEELRQWRFGLGDEPRVQTALPGTGCRSNYKVGLVWTGRDYAIAWFADDGLRFRRVGIDGVPTLPERLLRPIEGDEWCRWGGPPDLAAIPGGVAVAWVEGNRVWHGVILDGAGLGAEANLGSAPNNNIPGNKPSVAYNGDEIGVAWGLNDRVYFAALSPAGNVLRAAHVIVESREGEANPHRYAHINVELVGGPGRFLLAAPASAGHTSIWIIEGDRERPGVALPFTGLRFEFAKEGIVAAWSDGRWALAWPHLNAVSGEYDLAFQELRADGTQLGVPRFVAETPGESRPLGVHAVGDGWAILWDEADNDVGANGMHLRYGALGCPPP